MLQHRGADPAAPVESADDLEQLLLGLADGSYVLSTPDGAVAECGEGVGELLATPCEALARRPTAGALLPGADAATRAALDRLLRGDGADPGAVRAVTAAGEERLLRFVVVAVPLALGWEFTSLLSELGSRDAGTWHVEALRPRHSRALEAIEGVCASGAQPAAGARLAGILVVVRDAGAPALRREDVDRRKRERRAAARAAEAARSEAAAATTGDQAGAAGDAPAEAPALADLVESARLLRQRVEEAEREAGAASAERDAALARLSAAQAEHAAELERRQADDGRAGELAAERDEARARAEAADSESAHLRAALEAARADAAGLRDELAAARAELAGVQEELQSARAELETTLAAAQGARAEREQARVRAAELLSEAAAARAAAEAIRAAFAFEDPSAGERPQNHEAPGVPAAAVRPSSQQRPQLPPVAPGEAVALIGLDGAFRRLDDAFCSLLGYREEQLRAARWPSVIDRENLAAHGEIARALRAGEIDSAPVETVYMHAQGLLVPVAGTVSLHRPAGDDGEAYLLFRADVGRTAGAPA